MSVGGILEAFQQGLFSGADRSLVVQTDGDFASTLTLGQIIKGRVLRHYEGMRYGLSFDGQEKVVDTTLPLRPGELIQARVVNIGEQIHLQRVVGPETESREKNQKGDNPPLGTGGLENRDDISRLFARYQAALSADQHGLLQQLQDRQGGTNQVALSGLILNKLGLKLEPEYVRAIDRVLTEINQGAAPLSTKVGPSLPVFAGQVGISPELVNGLAPLLSQLLKEDYWGHFEPTGEPAASNAKEELRLPDRSDGDHNLGGSSKKQQEWFLGQWLLNVQQEGSVSHRFLRFPLWFGERLTEVSIALFAQKEQGRQGTADEMGTLKFRKAIFSLETDNLGHLEIEARIAVRSLRLEVTADSIDSAEFLGNRLAVLETALLQYGWQVDEISYHARAEQVGVMRSVVEHHINQDSFTRLM